MGVYDDALDALDQMTTPGTAARARRVREPTGNKRTFYERVVETYTEKLAKLERYPELDPHEDDTVLLVKRPMRTDVGEDRVLTYAALRAGGLWWISGKRELSGMSWSQLVEWLVTPIRTVRTTQGEASEVTLLVPAGGVLTAAAGWVPPDRPKETILGTRTGRLPRDSEELHERLDDAPEADVHRDAD